MENRHSGSEYSQWLKLIKGRIHSARMRVALAANSELIDFYYELGRLLSEKNGKWGSNVIGQLSKDLKKEFPDMSGFSESNLKYCRLFYKYVGNHFIRTFIFDDPEIRPQPVDELDKEKAASGGSEKSLQHVDELDKEKAVSADSEIRLQPVDEFNEAEMTNEEFYRFIRRIPWGHIQTLINKVKERGTAFFYIQNIIVNNWSRDTLAIQIQSELHTRQGQAVSNFKYTLPKAQSDLAQQILKDPYTFDFLSLTPGMNEREIEHQLVEHIKNFLLELGRGFAFVAQQYNIRLEDSDYYLDLLFYHTTLHCYVVIEIKNTEFKPEYAGKLNFYLSMVDDQLQSLQDNPTIGIIICRERSKIVAEYALRGQTKPIGVSKFRGKTSSNGLSIDIPENLKGSLPTVEELEASIIEAEKLL